MSLVKFDGYVQHGDTDALTNILGAQRRVMAAYPNALVTVYLTGTVTLADLFSDEAGLNPVGNPISADEDGYYSFYAADSAYDIRFSSGGIPLPWTVTNQVRGAALGDAVKKDGSVPLTAPWSAGNFNIDSRNSLRVFNVRAYLATGDGTTNDLPFLQNAVDAANAAGGGVVYFPPGIYLIGDGTDDEVRLRLHSNITLRGSGYDSVIQSNKLIVDAEGASTKKTRHPMIANWNYRQTAQPLQKNITIENLRFVGQRTTETFTADFEYYAAVSLSGVQNVTIRNNWFESFHGDGFTLEASHTDFDYNRDINIYNNFHKDNLRGGTTLISGVGIRVFSNEYTGQDFGVHLEPGSTTQHKTLQNVHMFGNTLHDITASTPLWMASSISGDKDAMANIVIENNHWRDCNGSNRSPFINVIGVNLTFANNTIRNCSTTGSIFFRATGAAHSITDNTFSDITCGGVGFESLAWPVAEHSDKSAFSWVGNRFFNVRGGTSTDVANAFFRSSSQSGSSSQYSIFHDNIAFIGGFYYGIAADVAGFSVRDNILYAYYTVGADPNPGNRGIFNSASSGASTILGNTIVGWVTPIYRADEKTTVIGHNVGSSRHNGFTANSNITMPSGTTLAVAGTLNVTGAKQRNGVTTDFQAFTPTLGGQLSVGGGTIETSRYRLDGNVMTILFRIVNANCADTTSFWTLALPAGKTVANTVDVTGSVRYNGTTALAYIRALATETTVRIYRRHPDGTGTIASSTGDNDASFSITLEVS